MSLLMAFKALFFFEMLFSLLFRHVVNEHFVDLHRIWISAGGSPWEVESFFLPILFSSHDDSLSLSPVVVKDGGFHHSIADGGGHFFHAKDLLYDLRVKSLHKVFN